MDELGTDGDEDDLDFWGGRSRVIAPETSQSEALQEEDERQDDLDVVMDYDVLDGGDDDDDNDHMEIFGHR